MSGVTLKEWLDKPYPDLILREEGDHTQVSKGLLWPMVRAGNIIPWRDFSVPILDTAWGDLYDRVVPAKRIRTDDWLEMEL